MLPAFGLAGSYSAGGFNTKAEALHFAIVFTATITESGNVPNTEKAQTLFDFITKNVQLPETKGESLDCFMSKSSDFLDSLYKRLDSIKENEYPATPEECCEDREGCGPSEAPPARPETELSQDRFKFDPRITPVGV